MTLIITKFEQSAFMVRIGGITYGFDFGLLTTPESLAAAGTPGLIFISHIHPDHLHAPNLRYFGCPVYNAPTEVVQALEGEPLDARILREGDACTHSYLTVTATPSDHGPNISAPVENIGFLLEAPGCRIFFAGDMAVPSPVPPGRFDVVLVPVGGGKVFNPDEAAAFIQSIGHHGIVVPIHYHGRADREAGTQFSAIASGFCDVRVLEVGETLEVPT